MAEYNALFDQHPWSYPTSQQSTPFPPYPTDQLGLLDQNSHSTSAWSQQPLTTNPIDPNNWFTNNQSPQLQPHHSELHSHSPIQQQTTNQSPLLSSLNQHIPIQQPQQSVLLEGMTHQRQASRLSFDNANPTTSPQQLHSPLSVSSNSNINYAPPPPPPPRVHSFLNGFTSSNAYPPPVSQEDYLRLLKQTQPQPQTSNIFPPSAPSPSSASARPDSSSSAHSSVNPYSSQPIASTSASSSNHHHQTFSLPPPAQFHHSSRTQHERTPSTNSSIRTSSQDRNSHHHLDQNQQNPSNSPARNNHPTSSSSYPTYPSPQQHSSLPYPLHQAPVPTQVGVTVETEYNPSEPYIPLTHPNHPHYHHFLAAQRHQQQQLNFAPPPSSHSQTNQNTIPNSLGFCPPAPGPLLQFPSAPANSSALLGGLGNNSTREIGAGPAGGGEELKLDSSCLDSKGKGKGKVTESDKSGGAGFVKPRRAGSSSGGGGERNGSISSTTGGRKRSYSANSPGAAEGVEERERNEGSEDPEEDDLVGRGGFGQSAQASTSTSSGAQLGGPGGGGPGAGGSKLILPNSIDPVTGYPRRQTEVPAVEDDPSVRPYGCNYCFLDRTKDASTRAYWSSRGKQLAETELRSWRTVKELREHSAREHRDRQDAIKDYEAELNENPELEKNGKGPEQPFRCALEPCGKTFKSLAGLRFHFQNASANGHFLVTMEKDTKTGEERPTKKFKSDVQPTGRELTCPVDRCPKRFKQSAGLAYHLSHTPNHPITEEDLSMFEATLQSKTRWWFRKLGLQFAKP